MLIALCIAMLFVLCIFSCYLRYGFGSWLWLWWLVWCGWGVVCLDCLWIVVVLGAGDSVFVCPCMVLVWYRFAAGWFVLVWLIWFVWFSIAADFGLLVLGCYGLLALCGFWLLWSDFALGL